MFLAVLMISGPNIGHPTMFPSTSGILSISLENFLKVKLILMHIKVGKFIFKNRMYTLNNKVISLVWSVTYRLLESTKFLTAKYCTEVLLMLITFLCVIP